MRRFQLIEIEDQPWCLAPIRDGGTDYMQFVAARALPYRPVVPRLAAALQRTSAAQVIDLCSGAGGPWPTLLPLVSAALGRQLDVCLTDRYPNIPAWQLVQQQSGGRIAYEQQPVEAGRVPSSLSGFRTLFSGFHHFPPQEAARILSDAVRSGQGIGIFEATERRATALIGMLFVPLIIALVTPAIRPFRWSRLLFTYLLPAIPIMGLVDGMISCLRTYTTAELNEMARPLAHYSWEIGQQRATRLMMPITYAIGYPAVQD